ncbi:MAG: tRNA (5-methylaminomethyl-2-thiouridine)(34)-methyltransferase MnmD [Flavobacteriales bacterium]|nr:tRNA (5-methylaminomethyl-2-thiouridine)(34)-methyltransferase MnmD [Flavobacteriales bacterium]MCB9191988.1 tRNA (5-methylaminomethyl-2-thiouridine)(34)-methyltransferase MnmD [Flavobacteriales bacterium]MCB9205008.1 tRNA (5-methylaminomethyl-2-thiouridine)(34)-methyltransferase MnmD [Flavobacteriales bacterium]
MQTPKESDLKLVTTKDGSQTILNTTLGSTYHSRHGALTESNHVFLDQGLKRVVDGGKEQVRLFEMGFGTGLNALLTWKAARESGLRIDYHGLELYPVPENVWMAYELPAELKSGQDEFRKIHEAAWNTQVQMDDSFQLTKNHLSLTDYESDQRFDLIYYDAFEPETQPELWTEEVFEKLFGMMEDGGVLTTYCCKGYVRRNMIAAGFVVEKVPGPPGKREMIVAHRPL